MNRIASDKPLVTVVVVTRNHQSTIARALDSVLNQQADFRFEIELADDCSDDRTSDICRSYALEYPTRIKYTRNKQQLGVRETYFRALRRCNSPYVANFSGEDYWVDEAKLRKQVALIERNPDVGLVHTAWCYVDVVSGTITQANSGAECVRWLKPLAQRGELLEAVFEQRMLINRCTALYRKSIFDEAYSRNPELFCEKGLPFYNFQLNAIYARESCVAYLPDITMYHEGNYNADEHFRAEGEEFDFVYGLLRLKHHYAGECPVKQSVIKNVYRRYARLLYTLAFINYDIKRMHTVDKFYKANHLPRAIKCRLMHYLTHIPLVGYACAKLKKAHYYWIQKQWI